MKGIATFMKVSRERFEKDAASLGCSWDDVTLPHRATAGSAGYDIYAPIDFELAPGEILNIPTGLRARIEPGWVLLLLPRSGQGFKYGVRLMNTAGVIDSDYFGAENEGHIFIKLINGSTEDKTLRVKKGEAFAQGIFLPYGLTTDDDATAIRTGGFGSTTKQ